MKKRIIGLILILTVILSELVPFSLIVSAETAQNVAIDKPVSCSTYNANYLPKNITDGNLNNFWTSGSEKDMGLSAGNQFVQVDLEEKYSIHEIIVRSRRDMDQPGSRENWVLYGANKADFSDKVELGQKKYADEYKSDLVALFPKAVEFRYIRLEKNGYAVVAEIEIYGLPTSISSQLKPEYCDIENPKELNAAILIENLGIINSVSSTTYGKDFLVTAEEAAVIVAKARGAKFSEELSAEQVYLETLNYGVILPTGVARTDYISKLDFIYMMEHAFGYDPYFEIFGGYPQGVVQLGRELELFDGDDGSLQDNVSKINIACIISDFLKSRSIQLSGSGKNAVYDNSDITWLEKIFNLKINEGIVTGNYYTTLFDPKESWGSGTIDNVSYADEKALLSGLVGKNVIYLTDADEYNTIRFAWENESKNEVIEVTATNIKDVHSNLVETHIPGNKRIKLQSPYHVIRNGVAYLNFDPEQDFFDELATFTFIDNDDDGVYEVIYYDDPVLVVSEHVAVNDGEELLVIGQNNINIKLSDYEELSIFVDGAPAPIGSIAKGSLMYLYYSEDNNVVRIEVSSKNVIGRISSISQKKIVVDGETFEVVDYFANHRQEMSCVKVGEIAKFLLNSEGKVVIGVDAESSDSEKKFSMILSAYVNDLDPYIRFYDETGVVRDLPFAKKVTIDGRRKTNGELSDILTDNPGIYTKKAAIYRTNSNGEVVFVDTEEHDWTFEDENSLQKLDVNVSGARSSGWGLYKDHKMLVPLDPSTRLLSIPLENGKIASHRTYLHLFASSEIRSVLPSGTTVSSNYNFYNADEFGCPQYAVCMSGIDYLDGLSAVNSATANSMLITEMFLEYNASDDEVLTAVKGIVLQTGITTTLYISSSLDRMYDLNKIYSEKAGWLNNYKNINEGAIDNADEYVCHLSELEIGDIIRYQLSNSRVTRLERIFDKSGTIKKDLELSLGNNNGSIQSWFRLVSGSIDQVNGSKLGIDTMNTKEIFDYSLLNSIIVCDGKYVNSHKSSTLPILAEIGDACVFYMSNASPKLLIIYK